MNSNEFFKFLENFNYFGKETQKYEKQGIPYFENSFWTSKQRAAKSIHEISYRACFKPQLVSFFIKNLANKNDVIYDPFMGRGTTVIESAILGFEPVGNDINPLSMALVEPRLMCPSYTEIEDRLNQIPFDEFNSYDNSDLLVFYHPKVLSELEGLRNWFIQKESDGTLDIVDKWIRMVAINRLTGHSSGFFSVYTMPPNQAVSIERQRKINERLKQKPPYRNIKEIILKKSKSLLRDGRIVCQKYSLHNTDASKTYEIRDNSINLVITSPPFLDVIDYKKDNWLRCWFLGIDADAVPIAQYGSLPKWRGFIGNVLGELGRVVAPYGYVAFEVGEVRSNNIYLDEHVIEVSKQYNLKPICVIVNNQSFTKTSKCWNIDNNKKGTNTNRIVLFQVV